MKYPSENCATCKNKRFLECSLKSLKGWCSFENYDIPAKIVFCNGFSHYEPITKKEKIMDNSEKLRKALNRLNEISINGAADQNLVAMMILADNSNKIFDQLQQLNNTLTKIVWYLNQKRRGV